MPLYRTRYALPLGESRTTQCYAENATHLEEVIKQRGMGEVRDDPLFEPDREPRMASELVLAGQLSAANHALIWTSMIAVRAGITDAWALLNDRGVVHEMAHALHVQEVFRQPVGLEALAGRIEAFERLVPGVHPCWAGEDRSVVVDYHARMREIAARAEARRVFEAGIYGNLYPYQRAAAKAIMQMGNLQTAMQQAIYAARQGPVSLAEFKQALIKHKSELVPDVVIQSADEAPRAKIGSRKFADHQRQQGQAVKERKKADLVAKLKANLSGAQDSEAATESPVNRSAISAVRETTYGVTPTQEAITEMAKRFRVGRGARGSQVIIDDPIDLELKHAPGTMDGQQIETINWITIGIDPAGAGADRTVLTARSAHGAPVYYEALPNGGYARMVEGKAVDDRLIQVVNSKMAQADFSEIEARALMMKDLLNG